MGEYAEAFGHGRGRLGVVRLKTDTKNRYKDGES